MNAIRACIAIHIINLSCHVMSCLAPFPLRDLGHATRSVIRDPIGRKKLLMFAEAANTQNNNCIAVYGSDDGMTWEDMCDEPVFKVRGMCLWFRHHGSCLSFHFAIETSHFYRVQA